MGVTILEVSNLEYWGNRVRLRKPFSFALEAGDIGVVISQNLSCCSNLLRSVIGLPPSRSVSICGYQVSSSMARHLFGFVSGCSELYDDLTVWQFLNLFVDIYSVDLNYRPYAIYEALELTRLVPFKDTPIEKITDLNVRKRICLARALVHSPRLLVVENIFQGSDFRSWQLIADIVNDARNTGKAVLVSAENLLHINTFYSQLFLIGEDDVILSGKYPDVVKELAQYQLIQIQVLDEGVEALLSCLEQAGNVFNLLQKEDDLGVFRFFFKGTTSELQALTAKLSSQIPIISCISCNNFFGR